MSSPVVHVNNNTSRDLYIDHDPNWDDQVLLIDGEPIPDIYCLPANSSTKVSIDMRGHKAKDEYLMGIIFSDGKNYDYGPAGAYQSSIGHDPNTGLLGVTDESTLKNPAVRYTIENQTDWSVEMKFVDF